MNRSIDAVRRLLHLVPRAPESAIPGPATADELAAFDAWLGFRIPADLRQWLEISNGPLVGPGGLFGVGSADDFVKIERHLSRHPDWLARKWIPIAGDGCGNYYLLVASGEFGPGHPIVFVDTMAVALTMPRIGASFVVASDLWIFLEGLLQHEIDAEVDWMFDQSKVIARDPAILDVVHVAMPWNAD